MSIFRYRTGKNETKIYWRAEVYFKGEKVISKGGFETRKSALKWKIDQLEKLSQSARWLVNPNPTFEDLMTEFERRHMSEIRPGTKLRYEVDLMHRILPFFKYRKLGDINDELLAEFKEKIVKELRTPKSVNNCLHTLRLLLNKAVEYRLLVQNPYNLKSMKLNKRPYVWWDNKEHIARFLVEAKKRSRYYGVFVLALETGMRLGEIIGLCKQDVDFENGKIRVWRQWNTVAKAYSPCKHDCIRWIDFNVKSLFASTLKIAVRSSSDAEIIFITKHGRRVTAASLSGRYFKNLIRRAGVPIIPFHALRHTFASWYMIEHDNIWDLQYLLGHASASTTQIYAHMSTARRKAPVDMLGIVEQRI